MARLNTDVHPVLDEKVVYQLESQKIYTVFDFMQHSYEKLMRLTGLKFKDIDEIRELIFIKFGGKWTLPSIDFKQSQQLLSTGIESLDYLLDGGLRTGDFYELCGLSTCGKSQICHYISVSVALRSHLHVHYIDSSQNFCGTKVQLILEKSKCSNDDVGRVMNSYIHVYKTYANMNELFSVLYSLSKPNNRKTTKNLIIIDALSTFQSQATSSKQIIANFDNIASVCRYMASQLEATIITVNTVTKQQDTESYRPALGKYWLSVPNTRLYITQLINNKRKVTVWKSADKSIGSSCDIALG